MYPVQIAICESDIKEKYYRNANGQRKLATLSKENFTDLHNTVQNMIRTKEDRERIMTGLNFEALYERAEKILEPEHKKEQIKERLQELKEEREEEKKREKEQEQDRKLEQEPKKEQGQKQKQEKKEQQAGISPSTSRMPLEAPSLKNAVGLSPKEAEELLRASTAQLEKKPLEDFNSRRSAEFEELEKRHEASRIDYRSVADNLPKKGRFEIWGFKKRLQEWEKRSNEAYKQYAKDRDEAEKHKADTAAGRKEIHKKATEAAKLAHPEAVAAIKQDEERKKAERQHQLEEQKQQRKEQRQQREEQRQQSKSRRKQLRR